MLLFGTARLIASRDICLEVTDRIDCTDYAVLVKAVTPVGAAVIRRAPAIDLAVATLGGDAPRQIDGVRIGVASENPGWVDRTATIQREEQLDLCIERLQHVHVIGDGDRLLLRLEQVIVPGGTRKRRTEQESLVGVQDRLLAAYGNAVRTARSSTVGSVSIASA